MDWITARKFAAPAAACAGAFAFLVAPGHATRAQKARFYTATMGTAACTHRDGTVPENSLSAFRAAAEAGFRRRDGRAPDDGRPARRVPRRHARAHVRRAGCQ